MRNLLFVAGCLLSVAPQEDEDRRVAEQIERLGSDEASRRDDAAKQLRALGRKAVARLEKAAKQDDIDLAARAREILKLIEDDLRPRPKIEDLQPDKATLEAPAEFKVRFQTGKGEFTVHVHREWAPLGADRFYNLVKMGYYDDCRFFRVIPNFMCQFGMHGEPKVSAVWKAAKIADDPVTQKNTRGRISFATAGPHTRTTQLFINYKDNSNLDGMGFAPFGEVTAGMDVVDGICSEYGEGAPRGEGPAQPRILSEGNEYLKEFPKLDYIKSAKVVE